MRVLCYLPSAPWPAESGTHQRSALLVRALGTMAEVEIAFRRFPKDQERPYLSEYRFHTYQGGLGKEVRPNRISDSLGNIVLGSKRYVKELHLSAWLSELMKNRSIDAIVGRYGFYSAEAGIPDLPHSVIDIDDLMSISFRKRSRAPGVPRATKMVANLRSHLFRRIERRTLAGASHLWLPSYADMKYLGLPNSSVLPNIPFHPSSPLPLPTGEPPILLFVGRLSWPPNSNGVVWFLRDVWPVLLSKHPELRFRIVGGGLSEALADEWSAIPGVDVAGYVDDLIAEYQRATIVIAPLFEGAGTKIKILEALAFGRPCITTPAGHEGLADHIQAGESIRVAPPDDFATACLELVADRAQRAVLGEAGFRVVSTHYSFDRIRDEVGQVLERVVNVVG